MSARRRLNATQIKAKVPMAELLRELGFDISERSRRTSCRIHGGRDRTAFSWNESVGHCFSCGFAGDKIALVQAVLKCDFRQALQYLANLAGVGISDDRPSFSQLHKHREKEAETDIATEKLRLLEGHMRASYRGEIDDLERIKELASDILKAKHERSECDRESEWAWKALQFAYEHLPAVLAGYSILSFANAPDRARFALYSEEADRIAQETRERGYVIDDREHMVEVLQ